MDDAAVAKLDAFIRKKGLRRTPQRDAIVRLAFASDDHFTSEELFDRVRKHNLNASRATVYRTIALLVEAAMIQEIDLGGDLKTYDPNFLEKPSHNHLVCIDCGKVVEFEDSHLDLQTECLTRRLGYRAVRQSLRIEATCERLRQGGSCSDLIAARVKGKRLPNRKK
jgi:Fur family ferric uptake transcriptional regulator